MLVRWKRPLALCLSITLRAPELGRATAGVWRLFMTCSSTWSCGKASEWALRWRCGCGFWGAHVESTTKAEITFLLQGARHLKTGKKIHIWRHRPTAHAHVRLTGVSSGRSVIAVEEIRHTLPHRILLFMQYLDMFCTLQVAKLSNAIFPTLELAKRFGGVSVT